MTPSPPPFVIEGTVWERTVAVLISLVLTPLFVLILYTMHFSMPDTPDQGRTFTDKLMGECFFLFFTEILLAFLSFSVCLLVWGLFKPVWLVQALHYLGRRLGTFVLILVRIPLFLVALGLVIAVIQYILK